MAESQFRIGDRVKLRYAVFPFLTQQSGIIVRVFYGLATCDLYDVLFDAHNESHMFIAQKLVKEALPN